MFIFHLTVITVKQDEFVEIAVNFRALNLKIVKNKFREPF